jgi:hypothetical protein
MPPRRSADAAAAGANPDGAHVSALPPALLLAVLGCLPVHVRLRCREVNRGWRDALNDPAAWAVIDLTADSGGVAAAAVTDALLRAACARADGALSTLNVSGCDKITHEALRAVLAAHGASLRSLVAHDLPHLCQVHENPAFDTTPTVTVMLEQLLAAAPLLEALECDACVFVCLHRRAA